MTVTETGEQREERLQGECRRLETAQQREVRLQRIRERRVLKRQNTDRVGSNRTQTFIDSIGAETITSPTFGTAMGIV